MSAPREICEVQPVEVGTEQRLAISSERNSAFREVTNWVMPEERRNQAAMQMKGLSPEITYVLEADTFHIEGRQNRIVREGENEATPTGSKTAAWDQKDDTGTRDIQSASRQEGISSNNLKRGEGVDGALEVGLTRSTEETANYGGGKGLAVICEGTGNFSLTRKGKH